MRQGAPLATGGALTHRPGGVRREGGGLEFRQRHDPLDAPTVPRAVNLAAVGARSPQTVRRSIPSTGHQGHARGSRGPPSRGARPRGISEDLGGAAPCLARPAPPEAGPKGTTGVDVHPHRHGLCPRHLRAWGLAETTGLCSLCQAEPDTLAHRMWRRRTPSRACGGSHPATGPPGSS